MRQEWIAFVGSLRKDSYNRSLFRALRDRVPTDVSVEEAVIGALPFYNPDMDAPFAVRNFWQRMRQADALLIVTPEYNGSFPAVIKNAIDWASRHPEGSLMAGKPTAILGASMGKFGTIRAQMHLRQVLTFLDADVIHRPEVLVAEAHQKIRSGDLVGDDVTMDLLDQLIGTLYRRVQHLIAVS